jgi:zinc protease
MSFSAFPGGMAMTMLTDDLPKGLEILAEIVTRSTFGEKQVEKVRDQILIDIKNFWDQPSQFASLIIKQNVYKGHPYSRDPLGSAETIAKITRKDLIDFYKKFITPCQARIAIVGDLNSYDLKAVFERELGKWQGSVVQDQFYPALAGCKNTEIDYEINRDQVVLCYAGLSVDRDNPDYDKLNLFNQILGSGVLGSMHSRLFRLREQTGLFYSIGGTLTANSDKQPGMVLVKTMVSLDRLGEAEKAIKDTLATVTQDVSQDEFVEARNAIVNSLVNSFESNSATAQALLALDRFNFPANYYDNRAKTLSAITVADMKDAVNKVLKTDSLITVRIGRIAKES